MKPLNAIVLIILFWIPSIGFSKGCDIKYLESVIIEEVMLTWEEEENIIISNIKIGNTIHENGKNIIILLTFNKKHINGGKEEELGVVVNFDGEKCEPINDGLIELKPVLL